MGTQQPIQLDPNAALAPFWMKNAPRNRSYGDESFAVHSGTLQDEQVRSFAQLEAKSWKLISAKSDTSLLQQKWMQSKQAIESQVQTLKNLVAAGQVLDCDSKFFLNEYDLVRETVQGARKAVEEPSALMHVALAGSRSLPRAYVGVASYFRGMNYEFDEKSFEEYFTAAQQVAPFEMAELWKLRPFAEVVLLEAVAECALALETTEKNQIPSPEDSDTKNGRIHNIIFSLRAITNADWKELFERMNVVEKVLRTDSGGAYPRMDFESREIYRKTIARMAKRSQGTEQAIAQVAVNLANRGRRTRDDRLAEHQSHVGYYLVGKGRKELEQEIGYRRTIPERLQSFVLRWPDFSYILGIELLTFAVIAAAVLGGGLKGSAFAIVALLLLPAAECAVALINQIVTTLFPPHVLPKMDFSEGIPLDCTAVVVVPTLLSSEEQMRRAVRDLEIRFLANRDSNLHFALLTDPPDSSQQFDERDKLAPLCAELIEGLNRKYGYEDKGSFFLFHRHRSYNQPEGIWMGWERKRGKLLDFNNLLLGSVDNFPVKSGDLSILRRVKYVITLDLDTQLPRDAARRLVGAMAHPLNKPVVDPETNTVIEGYGILQPRVDISIQSAHRSRLAALFSSDAGFDIYTRAVSDVYQDLFGEGSFTGKGIYEVATFQQVLEHRFPCNTILSHDMIEGSYARAGLVSDIEVIDDYPSHMSAFSRRKHRWVRGDWQILFWLLPRVPDFFGKMVRNPLSIMSRWKILDNLRRSLTEMAMFVMLLCGWLFFPGQALYWTLATLAILALPTFTSSAVAIFRAGRNTFTSDFWRNFAADFGVALANLFMRIACLCHQSLVTIDAVVRAVVRMTVTHERLLEWETAAEAEERSSKKSPVEIYLEITPWLAFFVGLFLAVDRPESFMVALPLLVLWGVSKPIVQWLSLPAKAPNARMEKKDEQMLRDVALRTWRLFREFSTPEENWLIPDTVQSPASLIVHRISTTNLGLLLNAPIFPNSLWSGVVDHLEVLEDILQKERWDQRLTLVQRLKQRAKSLGSKLERWAEALPELERDAIVLDKALSHAGGESAWWGHELCLRFTHLEALLQDFAPWLAPQFAKHIGDRDFLNITRSERLSLQSLPRICAALERKLAEVLEHEEAGTEAQSALRLLRSATARTSEICASLDKRLNTLAQKSEMLAKDLSFTPFYDAKKKALSIGYEVEEQRVAPYFYDLLPSEARAAAFVAIAKGEIPQESWLSLERRYTSYAGEHVLLSWTGTMFEYLMPMLWMKTYPNTILDETTQAAVRAQQKFAEGNSIPWGISESSCLKLSVDGHYHYQAFGVPALGINPEKPSDVVVSPYSTFLALMANPTAAVENLRAMQDLNLLGTYGFYEAADFTPSRLNPGNKCEPVRCWLAHHQGMSLMAVANVLCNSAIQRRFHAEPVVAATERLLHEKAPRTVVLEPTPEFDTAAAAAEKTDTREQDGLLQAAKLNSAA